MKNTQRIVESFEGFHKLDESFWISTTEWKIGDKNGTTFLNVRGTPGSAGMSEQTAYYTFVLPIREEISKNGGVISKEIVDFATDLFYSKVRYNARTIQYLEDRLSGKITKFYATTDILNMGAVELIVWLASNIGKIVRQ